MRVDVFRESVFPDGYRGQATVETSNTQYVTLIRSGYQGNLVHGCGCLVFFVSANSRFREHLAFFRGSLPEIGSSSP